MNCDYQTFHRFREAVKDLFKSQHDVTVGTFTAWLEQGEQRPTAPLLWEILQELQPDNSPSPKRPTTQDVLPGQLIKYVYNSDCFPSSRSLAARLPSGMADFAREYLSVNNPHRLLNPWCEDPKGFSTLAEELPSVQEAVAVVPDPLAHWRAEVFNFLCAKFLGQKHLVSWIPFPFSEDLVTHFGSRTDFSPEKAPLRSLDTVSGEWDAVVCAWPLGRYYSREGFAIPEHPNVKFCDGAGAAMLAASSLRLTKNGASLYHLRSEFIAPERSDSFYVKLESLGLKLDAYLRSPRGYGSRKSDPELGVFIVSKGSQESIFIGELQDSTERRKMLIQNLRQKRIGGEFGLGALVAKAGFEDYTLSKLSAEYDVIVKRCGLPTQKFKDIVMEVNAVRRKSFVEKPHSVALDFDTRESFQLVLNPETTNSEFFSKWMRTEVGLAFQRFISYPRPTLKTLRRGIPLPLPVLADQVEALKLDIRLRNLTTDIENLRKQLWIRPDRVQKLARASDRVNRDESLDDWLKTLPFPLASILRGYHAAAHDPKDQYKYLLKYFEALAEFHAIILLSAAKRDSQIWEEVRTLFREQRNNLHLERSTFGTWVEVTAFLSKRLRELWNQPGREGEPQSTSGRERCESALCTGRQEAIEMLTSKKLVSLHSIAGTFRNDDAHFGILSEEVARNLLVRLESLLAEVRSCFGEAWRDYQLVQATNRAEYTGQRHEVVVNLLQGPTTPFLKETRNLASSLKRNTLYLLDKERLAGVELLPLVMISNSPKEALNACYFYNSKQQDGNRYVSFHFEKKPEDIFAPEGLAQLFKELLC